MKSINTNTKTNRLIKAFKNGEELTAKQIEARFNIKNATATISDIRLDYGYAIYANRKTDTKGRETTKYSIGLPSRKVVAAGYRYLATFGGELV